MNLDDIMRMAVADSPTALDRARTRRTVRRIVKGAELFDARNRVDDVDTVDPFEPDVTESSWVVRSAQLAKHGTVSWSPGSDVLGWSDEMALMLGRAPGVTLPTPLRLLESVHPDDREMAVEAVRRSWAEQVPAEFTVRAYRRDRALRHLSCLVEILSGLDDDSPTGMIATVEDITEEELNRREQGRQSLRRSVGQAVLTERDRATDLLARSRFLDLVDAAARTDGGALLIVAVEPVSGQSVADEDTDRMMSIVACVLQQMVNPGAVCGLVGAGEIGVLQADRGATDAEVFAAEVVQVLREQLPIVCRGRLEVWAGTVLFARRQRLSGLEVLLDARTAWRQARRDGRPGVLLRTPLAAAVRDGVNRDEVLDTLATGRLALYSQPIMDLTRNEITRHEILLRVLDDSDRPGPPSAFLDDAERLDEVLAVDEWVIDRSLSVIARGSQTTHFQINLSGRSISHPALLPFVESAFERHGVEPSLVTFEITESAVINNLTAGVQFGRGLERLGCRMALDDFGTGYASLRVLKYLPIDLVKIDGDFVADLPTSAFDRKVVSHVIDMCADLGVRTGAEYVQDHETLELLRAYRADFAQGYLIGRPTAVFPATPDSGDRTAADDMPAILEVHHAAG